MFGIGLGVNVPSAPLREFYTPGQTKEPGRKCTVLHGSYGNVSNCLMRGRMIRHTLIFRIADSG